VSKGAKQMRENVEHELFQLVNSTEPIKPMFENTWSANLAVFSVLLEESVDNKITELCIEGFMHAIKISGFYQMHTERDAFVSSLSKFTQVSAVKEIKEKNIECIRALLNLASYEGNYLKNSWFYVLDCISKIDYMHVLGTGARKDSDFFNTSKKAKNPLV
jgi:brefeldin A-inhibited guanine nucleotide-exchange protein